jgi:hypothetical protein
MMNNFFSSTKVGLFLNYSHFFSVFPQNATHFSENATASSFFDTTFAAFNSVKFSLFLLTSEKKSIQNKGFSDLTTSFSDLTSPYFVTGLSLLSHFNKTGRQMNGNFSNTNSSLPCWIYILQGNSNADYQVGYTVNLPERIQQMNACGGKLVYLRIFNDFIDAIGHKLFLEQITTPSLRRIVRMHNPELNDLKETIL